MGKSVCKQNFSLSEGVKFIEILNDHHLEQLVHFPTRERDTLDLIITSLPSQFLDIQSPDRLSDHDIVSGTLKIVIPPIKKPRRKVFRKNEPRCPTAVVRGPVDKMEMV